MAIALDTTTDGGIVSATSLTFAHTCTGSNLILWVAVTKFVDDITSVTYNGVAMTLAKKTVGGGGMTSTVYLFYLVNPATGSNNVVISASTSGSMRGMAASYTGAAQTGQPDATGSSANASVGSGIDSGCTVTTVADNCWSIMFARCTATGTNMTAGTGTTLRQTASVTSTVGLFDSNGAKTPPGNVTLNGRVASGTQDWGQVIASFAPATSAWNLHAEEGLLLSA